MPSIEAVPVGGSAAGNVLAAADEGAGVRAGTVLNGTYRVLHRLGTGGMGEIYAVEHTRIGRGLAAKVLRRELAGNADFVRRFACEAREVAKLRSDHVVSVLDAGTTVDGLPFLVMERLYGHDLREVLEREGPLLPTRAVALCRQASLGLRSAHAAGLIHRDLKPANLFVTRRDSGEELCKILDFGIARRESGDTTERGALLGTVRYMAPEQLREGGRVDRRTDIHALGAILYECLAGHPPHRGDCLERVAYAIMNERPRPLRELGLEVPPALDGIVAKALEKDPNCRFSSAEELLDALSTLGTRALGAEQSRADATTTDIGCTEGLHFPPRPRKPIVPLLGSLGALLGVATLAWHGRAPGRASGDLRPPLVVQAPARTTNARQVSGNPEELGATPATAPASATLPTSAHERQGNARTPAATARRLPGRAVEPAHPTLSRTSGPAAQAPLFDTRSPYMSVPKQGGD